MELDDSPERAGERPVVTRAVPVESSSALLRLFAEPRLESRPIRFAVDDKVVGIAGEAIDRALGADWIGEGQRPLFLNGFASLEEADPSSLARSPRDGGTL